MTLLLTKLELTNLFGLNTWIHSRDNSRKKKQLGRMAAYLLAVLCLIFQLSMQSYLLIQMNGAHLVPQIQGISAGLIIFLFSIFDHSLFSVKGYEMLLSLPVTRWAIARSRLLKLYIKYLLLGMLAALPGWGIYCRMTQDFIALVLPGILLIPLLPLSLSLLLNTAIALAASHSAHKTGTRTVLTVLLLLALLAWPATITGIPALPTDPQAAIPLLEQMLQQQFPRFLRMWPTETGSFLVFAALSLAVSTAMLLWIPRCFGNIMEKLSSVSRKHSRYSLTRQKSSLLAALYRKEAKAYFSSSVYVSNTILGPILATAAAALLFLDHNLIGEKIPQDLVPVIWCCICCMMNPSSVSISMEGDRIWILKSLPVSVKTMINAKLLWNLTLTGPACILSFLLLMIHSQGTHWLWPLMIMPTMVVFSAVFGITANLHLQNFRWQKDEEVVKQSAAALVGGLMPVLMALIIGAMVVFIPGFSVKLLVFAVLLLLTLLLYCHCRKQTFIDS